MSIPNFTGTIGPLLTRGDIEQKVLAHVKDWIKQYLAAVERAKGLTARSIAPPRAFDVIDEFKRFPEDQLPFIAVLSTGIDPGKPIEREGDGTVSAWWIVGVGAVVSARDARSAKDLSGYYGAALRSLMFQMPDTGDLANSSEWHDERYDDFPRAQERNLAATRLIFSIEVRDVMNIFDAPRGLDGSSVPLPDPYAAPTDYPDVVLPAHIDLNFQE